jgi:hypothetical protein
LDDVEGSDVSDFEKAYYGDGSIEDACDVEEGPVDGAVAAALVEGMESGALPQERRARGDYWWFKRFRRV